MTIKSRTFRRSALASLAVVAVATLAAATAAGVGNLRQGNEPPELTVPQDAAVSFNGISFQATRAEYSGTATFVELVVAAPKGVARVYVAADGFQPGSLRPTGDGSLTLPVGRPVVVRMRPVEGAPVSLMVGEVTLIADAVRPEQRISGPWHLHLSTPPDLAKRLWTERLTPGSGEEQRGITLSPIGAIRSATETLVTINLSGGDSISDLMLPTTIIDGARVGGSLIERDIIGGNLVFSFPATPRGTTLTVEMSELIRDRTSASTGFIDIALGEIMRRNGLTASFRERATVAPQDVTAPPGTHVSVIDIDFARTSDKVESADILGVRITGTFNSTDGFNLVLPDGSSVPAEIVTSAFASDAGGNLAQGWTRLAFRVGDTSLLDGTVRLNLGAPSEIIAGAWTVTFDP